MSAGKVIGLAPIGAMVATKQIEASKKLLDNIVLGNKSNFVNTRFIL